MHPDSLSENNYFDIFSIIKPYSSSVSSTRNCESWKIKLNKFLKFFSSRRARRFFSPDNSFHVTKWWKKVIRSPSLNCVTRRWLMMKNLFPSSFLMLWEIFSKISQVPKNMVIRDVIKLSSCPANINHRPTQSICGPIDAHTKFSVANQSKQKRFVEHASPTTGNDGFNECNKMDVYESPVWSLLSLAYPLSGSTLDRVLRRVNEPWKTGRLARL